MLSTIPVAISIIPFNNAFNPSITTLSPIPIAVNPTPRPIVANENIPNDADTPNNVGAKPCNNLAEIANTANTPDIINNDLPILPRFILPSDIKHGVNTASAVDAVINAIAPFVVPSMALRPKANITNEPPIAVKDLPIDPHFIPDALSMTPTKLSTASPTNNNPIDILTMFLGIILAVIAIADNIPAIPVSPLPICFHLRLPI